MSVEKLHEVLDALETAQAENLRLQEVIESLASRVATQSEVLSRLAERDREARALAALIVKE